MVNSHVDILFPGLNESRFAPARNRVSRTRSLARSALSLSEMANARSDGTAASIKSRTALQAGGVKTFVLVFPRFSPRPSDHSRLRTISVKLSGTPWLTTSLYISKSCRPSLVLVARLKSTVDLDPDASSI
jgi:hypothetical protein